VLKGNAAQTVISRLAEHSDVVSVACCGFTSAGYFVCAMKLTDSNTQYFELKSTDDC